jgi:biopolymer transport protein ExbD
LIALPRRTSFEEPGLDFTPLASIGVILLSLFLGYAALARRPEVEAGAPLMPNRADAADSIVVRISSGGTLHVKGSRYDELSFRQGFDEARFRQPDAPVIVVLEEGARASLLARVMDQLRLAGADRIRIALRGEGAPSDG